MTKRTCPIPGCPALIPTTARYCPTHAREYEARRGTPTQRGYDRAHRRLRRQWQDRIDSGHSIRCVTCGIMVKGIAWDLGHERETGKHIGPQCIQCNRSEGGREGRARQGEM
jgi:hypothetical protein